MENINERVKRIDPAKQGVRNGFLPLAGHGAINAPDFGSTPLTSIAKFPQANNTHVITKYSKNFSALAPGFLRVLAAHAKVSKNASAPQKQGMVIEFGRTQSFILNIVPSYL